MNQVFTFMQTCTFSATYKWLCRLFISEGVCKIWVRILLPQLCGTSVVCMLSVCADALFDLFGEGAGDFF